MSKNIIEDIYPLSPAQRGILLHTLYAPKSGVYLTQFGCTLPSGLDLLALKQSWQRVVDRHSLLRTAFAWERREEPLQIVLKRIDLPWAEHDWRGLSASEQQMRLEEYLKSDRAAGFDMSKAPLMRIAVFLMSEDVYQLVWTIHHILIDGWSKQLLLKEVFAFYDALTRGEDLSLEPPRPYRDYILWLRQQDLSRAETFWRDMLQGVSAPTPLTVDRPAPFEQDAKVEHDVQELTLSAQATASLEALARQSMLTLNTLVEAAWLLLLSRCSGQQDVVCGINVSGRPPEMAGAESMVGLFINTLPVRARVIPEEPLLPWLKRLQQLHVEISQYEYSPLGDVQAWSDLPGGTDMFESIFVFENYPLETTRGRGGNFRVGEFYSKDQSSYPLTIVTVPGNNLTFIAEYDNKRFDAATIERMLGHLEVLLAEMISDPHRPISSLTLLSNAERQQLLVEWNNTKTDSCPSLCIHQMFEAQVRRTPEAIAAVYEGQQLTYAELNRKANQLANYLRAMGVGPEVRVGICMERSLEMLVCVLGVLKAGGAYVPMDRTLPAERLAFMLDDSQVAVVLTKEYLVESLPSHWAQVISVDTDWYFISEHGTANLPVCTDPDSLAYIIYTSGSTGEPKGVLVQHSGVPNLLEAQIRAFDVKPDSRVLQYASLGFDASVWEIFMALVRGATLYLGDEDSLLPGAALTDFFKEHAISIATLPPSLLRVLPTDDLPALRTIITAGEACSADLVANWAPGRRFINAYGPTETTVCATIAQCVSASVKPSIGFPISNTQVYIVDPYMNPVPVGVAGELHIGGLGVARGYLNRPDLTAEKFIPDPFGDRPGARLYKTGDLVRYLPDGSIDYIGRIDHQVKLRGFRIELGEVESVLNWHPAVRESAVAVREDIPGDKRLVAYIVPSESLSPDSQAIKSNQQMALIGTLREHANQYLPNHMLPSVFVVLDALPLTRSGKIDRQALLAFEQKPRQSFGDFVAPRSPIEELLASIWSEMLVIPEVGAEDNFFELGGHSLLATQVIARINDTFQVELQLRSLFDYPTVRDLADRLLEAIRDGRGLQIPPIKQASRDKELPLSFAQQRLWFLDQFMPDSYLYNISYAIRLEGGINVQALKMSFDEMIERHEVFRTAFATGGDGQPVQVISATRPFELPLIDLSHFGAAEREAEVQRLAGKEVRTSFDLAVSPLLRVKLLRLGDDAHVLLFTMHHIICDGWSVGIFIREITTLYEKHSNGSDVQLPELPIQYADFAVWQREWMQGDVLEANLAYWRKHLGSDLPALELPSYCLRPPIQSFEGAAEPVELPAHLADALKQLSRREGVSLFMSLLAAFQILLNKYSGQDDIVVGTPIANRNRAETEPLIGHFVNTVLMRVDLSGNPSVRQVLARVREMALNAYAHQDLPFEKLVEELQPGRDLSRNPLFQVMFALQNAPQNELELSGLSLKQSQVDSGTSKFDLSLTMTEANQKIVGSLEYNLRLFDARRIECMAEQFKIVIETMISDPECLLSDIDILTHSERVLLAQCDSTDTLFDNFALAHELFQSHAAISPDSTAIICDGERVTYAQLNQLANKLARLLTSLGARSESVVAICLDRSPLLVASLLAAWKAGAAFLYLDPLYPVDRLRFCLLDSDSCLLVSTNDLLEEFLDLGLPSISLDDNNQLETLSGDDVNLSVRPNDLAYLIYTSGTTGQPKAVLIEHSSLANLLLASRQRFDFNEKDRMTCCSSFAFDISLFELMNPLAAGGICQLVKWEEVKDTKRLAEEMREASVIHLVPSLMRELMREMREEGIRFEKLRLALVGGETVPVKLLEEMNEVLRGAEIEVMYGPTEATVISTSHRVRSGQREEGHNIGRPLANVKVGIFDKRGRRVGIGVKGEIYISGAGVSRGYKGREELNNERYVEEESERWYRTGDEGRMREGGEIEYVGRGDEQVKVRGYRIELGEIESVLMEQREVEQAVVVARPDPNGDNSLVAYLVSNSASVFSPRDIRDYLKMRLPEYMIPTAIISIDSLPLLPTGKVNRMALPEPDRSGQESENYVAPRNELEESVAHIWAEILKLDRVGVYDNFFDLGGHSLLATQLVSRLRKDLNLDISLRAVFETPSVAGLASAIVQNCARQIVEAPKIELLPRGNKDLDELLAEIDGLSDTEIQLALAEETHLINNGDMN